MSANARSGLEGDLVKSAEERLIAPDRSWLRTVTEVKRHVLPAPSRTPRRKEEQPIGFQGAAQRKAGLVDPRRTFPILNVAHSTVVAWIEDKPMGRAGAQRASTVIEPRAAVKLAASGPRHCRNNAPERRALAGTHPGCTDLNLREVFEHGVLAGSPINRAVGRNPVDDKSILGAAGTVNLNAAFNFAGIHAGRQDGQGLKRA